MCARPTLADVERLARGLAAARRGTGSRGVPHRLNAEEHRLYELAKARRASPPIRSSVVAETPSRWEADLPLSLVFPIQDMTRRPDHSSLPRQARGYAVLKGSGHRRERKGSPLLNVLRQRADALDECLVWCQQGVLTDHCCVDFSPRRLGRREEMPLLRCTLSVARAMGGAAVVAGEGGGWIEAALAGSEGSAAHLSAATLSDALPEADLESLPIWRVPPRVARFASPRAEPQLTKRLAKALVAALREHGDWDCSGSASGGEAG